MTAAQFLDTKFIYSSRYSQLRVVGGTFSFVYNETDMPLAPARAARGGPRTRAPPARLQSHPTAKKPAPKKKSSSGWDTGRRLGRHRRRRLGRRPRKSPAAGTESPPRRPPGPGRRARPRSPPRALLRLRQPTWPRPRAGRCW